MARERATKDTRDEKVGSSILPIALVFGPDRDYGSGVLKGIGRYAQSCDNWALISVLPNSRLGEALGSLKPSGIIVGDLGQMIPEITEALRKIARPVVNVTSSDLRFPQVTLDDASIGSVAANHLLECGLRNFGYFGPPCGDDQAPHREGGFRLTLGRLSHKVEVCHVGPPVANPSEGIFESHKHIAQWLSRLPKPAGIFAPTDMWALWLCGLCKREGIQVPEEIAIIGAGNDELLCELAKPTLSSVTTPAEHIGYEAAAMLNRLINREPLPDKHLFLPATEVVTRQSTNMLAGAEPVVSKAVRFIREHISEPITVEDVVRHARMPRRSFERKFRESIGRSPAQEICRMRVETTKTFLIGSDGMKTESIAKQCGFSSRAQFFMAFKQITGMTPADYRRTMEKKNSRGTSAGSSDDKS